MCIYIYNSFGIRGKAQGSKLKFNTNSLPMSLYTVAQVNMLNKTLLRIEQKYFETCYGMKRIS